MQASVSSVADSLIAEAADGAAIHQPVHHCADLIRLFNGLFADSEYNTRLVRGDDEPIYLPAGHPYFHNRIIFAHGFFASALHEISHWCVAGKARHQLEDFGYWYQPDGRTAAQQAAFEQVEVKPQALEWILSRACGAPFRISVDNLSGETTDTGPFKRAVYEQVKRYLQQGLAERPQALVACFAAFYQQPVPRAEHFSLDQLN